MVLPALCVLTLLPSLLFGFGIASSMAVGVVAAGAVLILFACAAGMPARWQVASLFFSLCALFLVTSHLSVVALLYESDFSKSRVSLLLLGVFLAASVALAGLFARARPDETRSVMLLLANGLLIIGFVAVPGWLQVYPDRFEKQVFPFTEPSHFALVLVPFLLFACVTSRLSRRIAYIAAGASLALLLQSLVLVVACLGITVLVLPWRYALALPAIATALALQLDLQYFASRVDVLGGTENLSALVFLQGWQLIGEAWTATSGLGRGFQQLGIQPTSVEASRIINTLLGKDLNVYDGGFMLAKLLGEFGALGLVPVLFYFKYFVASARSLRRVALGTEFHAIPAIAASCFIVGYIVELVARGAGYFTPTGVLLLASLWLMRAPVSTRLGVYRLYRAA